MLKRKIAAIMAAIMVMTCTGTVFAANQTVKVDGLIQTFAEEPIVKDEYLLVSLQEICRSLGASVERDKKARTFTAVKGGITMMVTEGKKEVYVNDDLKYFQVTPVMKNDAVMVPLRFVCEAFGAKVGYDAKTRATTVNTGSKSLQVLNKSVVSTDNVKVFTYTEALAKAVNANSTLKNLEDSVDYIEERRKDTLDNFNDVMLSPSPVDITKMAIELVRGLNTLQSQSAAIPYRQQILKDTSEYLLRNSLSTIAAYEMDIQMLEENIKLQNKNISNLTLKESLGMASENELRTAKQSLESSKSNLNSLKISLSKAQNGLKKVIDFNGPETVAVDYDPTVKPVNVTIKSYVTARVSEDPTVKLKQLDVDNAQYKLDSYDEDVDSSKLELENALNTASRDLYDTQRNLESAIRAAYEDIQALEERQKALHIDLQKAKDDYNTMVANYEAGLVTAYEVDALKLAILKIEIDLSKNAYNYWLLTYGFEKPYLLSSQNG